MSGTLFLHIQKPLHIRYNERRNAKGRTARCGTRWEGENELGQTGTERDLPRDRRTHRRRYLHRGRGAGAQRKIDLHQALYGSDGAAGDAGCAGICPRTGRTAAVCGGAHHHDDRTQIHPGGRRAAGAGRRRRVQSAAHRLCGLHGGRCNGACGERQAPHGQKPVVRAGGAIRPCGRDRYPQGHL